MDKPTSSDKLIQDMIRRPGGSMGKVSFKGMVKAFLKRQVVAK